MSPGLAVAELLDPGEVAYVARGTVAAEYRFNGEVSSLSLTDLAAPIDGLLTERLPERGTVVEQGEMVITLTPTPEVRAAAAELEAALLARRLGAGDPSQLESRVATATIRAEELGLPVGEEADLPLAETVAITAPIAGTVLDTYPPDEGVASRGESLAVIGDVADLVVVLSLATDQAQQIPVGATAIVASGDGRGDPALVTVASNERSQEDDNEDQSLIILEMPAGVFEYGERVRVVINGPARENVLWLPPQVIRSYDGKTFVLVVEGDVARRVDVVLGVQTAERVEVSGFLAEAEQVVGP